jgi:hypothetical protein
VAEFVAAKIGRIFITAKHSGYFFQNVREDYVLLWTAFVSVYSHETKKKLKEYDEWMSGDGGLIHTPDELIAKIQSDIKSKRRH